MHEDRHLLRLFLGSLCHYTFLLGLLSSALCLQAQAFEHQDRMNLMDVVGGQVDAAFSAATFAAAAAAAAFS